MKQEFKFTVFILVFVILMFSFGCTVRDDGTGGDPNNIVTKPHVKTKVEVRVELESIVCRAAEKGGSCNTKLAGIGLISKDDCCSSYEVCCK